MLTRRSTLSATAVAMTAGLMWVFHSRPVGSKLRVRQSWKTTTPM